MNSVSCLWSLLFISLAAPSAAQAQGAIEAWVQRYNGPANGDDFGGAMVLDATGNVYVTGASYDSSQPTVTLWQCVTLAYSSAGVLLWTNVYTAEGSRADGRAVAVDTGGNVYVTGASQDTSGNWRCLTIKYSSTGMPLWTNLYNAGSSTYGWAVALDPGGNVFVAASAGNASQSVTIKYSSAGAQLWTRTYSGCFPRAVDVDASGNVVVTGSLFLAGLPESPITIKYSSAGALLWTRTYSSPGDESKFSAAAVDGQGNVLVTGRSGNNNTGPNYLTIKYSGGGAPLWTNLYNGPGNDTDEAIAVEVDANGNVLVTGSTWRSGTRADYATIKYSSAGVPLWTNWYNGPENYSDNPKTLTLDATGNVFVTGTSESGSSQFMQYSTVAYSSGGTLLWTKRYNGPGNDHDFTTALAVDATGNVFVTGSSTGSGSGSDIATVKYVTPPIITRQPLSRTNAMGTTATFTIEVVGSAPFSYQWRRQGTNLLDGGNLSGVTTTNLLIADVQLADAGGYTVVVTNAYGSATSVVAQLTVTIPPSAGRFSNLSYSPQTGFSFILRDATVGKPYRIQRSPSMAEGSWVDWQSFTYSEPIFLTDMGATGAERRYYRAVSP